MVEADGTLRFEGRRVGSVGIVSDESGSQVAALVTDDGRPIDVQVPDGRLALAL